MKFKFKTHYQWEKENIGQATPEDGPSVAVAPPPVFKGPKGLWSPEDLFVSSLETCFFLSLLFVLKKSEVKLLSYRSEAEGVLERVDGNLKFTLVTIRPTLTIEGDEATMRTHLEQAHHGCLVSNSVACEVAIEPTFETAKSPA